ncbi:MAG: MBL fold metallo-hydrolase [Bacteroidaceae bacterium]|nr:MBL fold metallo-hydrolase [Bacteroidaceae bacterium]
MMIIKTFTVNPLQENCYVVSDETHEAVIIDCGAYYDEELTAISNYIETNGLHPVAHLLTHAHFDHILGAGYIYNRYKLAARMHPSDMDMFLHASSQPPVFMQLKAFHRDFGPAGEPVDVSEPITFGNHSLSVHFTPGHTTGGVCYYCADERILFSGDNLFAQSIGRTDFPGGDYTQLITALQKLMAALPDDVKIYPGHGPVTTAATERCYNPYLR